MSTAVARLCALCSLIGWEGIRRVIEEGWGDIDPAWRANILRNVAKAARRPPARNHRRQFQASTRCSYRGQVVPAPGRWVVHRPSTRPGSGRRLGLSLLAAAIALGGMPRG
jgi:hypothetical protein